MGRTPWSAAGPLAGRRDEGGVAIEMKSAVVHCNLQDNDVRILDRRQAKWRLFVIAGAMLATLAPSVIAFQSSANKASAPKPGDAKINAN